LKCQFAAQLGLCRTAQRAGAELICLLLSVSKGEGQVKFKSFAIFLIIGSAAVTPAVAQQPNAQLQALDDALPGTLINDPSKLDWPIFGPGVTSKVVKSPDIPGGGGAIQITSPKVAAHIYDIGANAPITAAVKSGQRIVIAFYARTVSAETPSGKGKLGLRVQQNAAPYPGFGDTVLDIGTDWQLYEVRATSNIDIAKGLAVVNFQFSGAKQSIQIGQTIIVEGADSIKTVSKTAAAIPTGPLPLMLPQLEGKGKLINDPAVQKNWAFYGSGLSQKEVPAKTLPTGSAIAVNVGTVGKNVYDAGASIPFDEAVVEGDVLTVAFMARTLSADTENGAGKVALRVQRNVPPYPGFGDNTLAIGPNWKLYQLRTQARQDIPKGEGAVSLQLAGARQELEFGPLYVFNAGPPAPAAN
jgi:hypothetical protein